MISKLHVGITIDQLSDARLSQVTGELARKIFFKDSIEMRDDA